MNETFKAETVAIAIKKGNAQVRKVSYNNKGVSTVTPLSDWVTLAEAQSIKANLSSPNIKVETRASDEWLTPIGDRCVICNADAYECEHYEREKTGEDWEIYWDERRAH